MPRIAAVAAMLAMAGCAGGGSSTGRAIPAPARSATAYPVLVSAAFPATQHLAETVHLLVTVHNIGTGTLPNVAVTVTTPPYGTSAQAFSLLIPPAPGLASRSRPIWIIDRPPGPCGYGCAGGGPGGAVTAYSNTWALGPLAPGHATTFDWTLTAVRPGRYTVAYRVVGSLDGRALAVLPGGRAVAQRFRVTILRQPRRSYVNDSGQVVYGP
ncbi:MAG: hypothetical protein ACLP01_13670 [Solirubrobacteraceae bacterium]